jgi:hypothetical protein
MALIQATATLTGYGLVEHYWLPTDPRPTWRDLLRTWPWGQGCGLSAPPPYSLEAPAVPGDPAVAAFNAKLVKNWGVQFP